VFKHDRGLVVSLVPFSAVMYFTALDNLHSTPWKLRSYVYVEIRCAA